jgi:hypothetical protein
MDQQIQPFPSEHHVYVSIAKLLFHHPEHGIVTGSIPATDKVSS